MNEVHEIDSESLNATIIGLAIRLAFLGVILFLSLSIIRPFFETAAWSVVSAVVIYQFLIWSRDGSVDVED